MSIRITTSDIDFLSLLPACAYDSLAIYMTSGSTITLDEVVSMTCYGDILQVMGLNGGVAMNVAIALDDIADIYVGLASDAVDSVINHLDDAYADDEPCQGCDCGLEENASGFEYELNLADMLNKAHDLFHKMTTPAESDPITEKIESVMDVVGGFADKAFSILDEAKSVFAEAKEESESRFAKAKAKAEAMAKAANEAKEETEAEDASIYETSIPVPDLTGMSPTEAAEAIRETLGAEMMNFVSGLGILDEDNSEEEEEEEEVSEPAPAKETPAPAAEEVKPEEKVLLDIARGEDGKFYVGPNMKLKVGPKRMAEAIALLTGAENLGKHIIVTYTVHDGYVLDGRLCQNEDGSLASAKDNQAHASIVEGDWTISNEVVSIKLFD